VSGVGVGQFTEDKSAPCQSPKLVGVGQRNGSADAQVLGGELLKEIADDPGETAEKEPEEQVLCLWRMEDRRFRASSRASTSAKTVPSSPMVKTVTKESGFMPLM